MFETIVGVMNVVYENSNGPNKTILNGVFLSLCTIKNAYETAFKSKLSVDSQSAQKCDNKTYNQKRIELPDWRDLPVHYKIRSSTDPKMLYCILKPPVRTYFPSIRDEEDYLLYASSMALLNGKTCQGQFCLSGFIYSIGGEEWRFMYYGSISNYQLNGYGELWDARGLISKGNWLNNKRNGVVTWVAGCWTYHGPVVNDVIRPLPENKQNQSEINKASLSYKHRDNYVGRDLKRKIIREFIDVNVVALSGTLVEVPNKKQNKDKDNAEPEFYWSDGEATDSSRITMSFSKLVNKQIVGKCTFSGNCNTVSMIPWNPQLPNLLEYLDPKHKSTDALFKLPGYSEMYNQQKMYMQVDSFCEKLLENKTYQEAFKHARKEAETVKVTAKPTKSDKDEAEAKAEADRKKKEIMLQTMFIELFKKENQAKANETKKEEEEDEKKEKDGGKVEVRDEYKDKFN